MCFISEHLPPSSLLKCCFEIMDIKDEIGRPPQCYGMTIVCSWSRDDDKSARISSPERRPLYQVFLLAVTVIYYFSRDIAWMALQILYYFSRDIAGLAFNELIETRITLCFCEGIYPRRHWENMQTPHRKEFSLCPLGKNMQTFLVFHKQI